MAGLVKVRARQTTSQTLIHISLQAHRCAIKIGKSYNGAGAKRKFKGWKVGWGVSGEMRTLSGHKRNCIAGWLGTPRDGFNFTSSKRFNNSPSPQIFNNSTFTFSIENLPTLLSCLRSKDFSDQQNSNFTDLVIQPPPRLT